MLVARELENVIGTNYTRILFFQTLSPLTTIRVERIFLSINIVSIIEMLMDVPDVRVKADSYFDA